MSATATGVAGAGVIAWGPGAHAFGLRSSRAEVLARAAVVFRPWILHSAAVAPGTTWTVEPDRAQLGHWQVSSSRLPEPIVAGSAERAVTVVEFRSVQALVDGPPDIFTVHAALVARAGRAVLIFGPSESGKSTLATALWQSGFSFLGDDVAMVDLATGDVQSVPRRVSLRTPSQALLGNNLWSRLIASPASEMTSDGCLFHPSELDDAPVQPARVVACVFLARLHREPLMFRESMAGLTRPLSPAQAALAVLPYSNLIRRCDAGALIPAVGAFTSRVSSFDLQRAPLVEMVSAVERAVEACG